MRYNHTLDAILRGSWFMDPAYLSGAGPLIQSFLEGKGIGEELPQAISEREYCMALDLTDVYGPDGSFVGKFLPDNEIPEGSTGVMRMTGPTFKYGGMCHYGADEMLSFLSRMDKHASITEIILYIDSPGGAVNAIAPFLAFAKAKKTPVTVLVDQCCSLGYWVACAMGDTIFADNDISTTVGSIGVQLSFLDALPYYEEKGYVFRQITPEESKDKNAIWMEILKGDYDNIKKLKLSPLAQKFQNFVRNARPDLIEEDGVLNGKTYQIEEAMRLGLVNGVRTLDELIATREERKHIREARRNLATATINHNSNFN